MMSVRGATPGRARSHIAVLATALAAAGALGACSSGASGSSGTATASGSTQADSQIVSQAHDVMRIATGKLVFSAKNDPTSASDFVPYGAWRGPTSAPAHQPGEKIEIIVCSTQSPACVSIGNAMKQAAGVLGWNAEIINADGTPQGFTNAFLTAINRSPAAIVTAAIPAAAVGAQLAEAKQKGILTVTGADEASASGPNYDDTISANLEQMNSLLAFADIADTNGKANVVIVQDPTFPILVKAAHTYQRIIGLCSSCKSHLETVTIATASDPTKTSASITGFLSQHPDATSLAMDYSVGLSSVVQAVESASKKVQLDVKDGDNVGLAAVRNGQVTYNAGTSLDEMAWAEMDQVVRGLAKQPFLTQAQVGLGVVLLNKATTPANDDIDTWPGLPDYKAQYTKIWK